MVISMNRNSIRWQLPISYAVIALLAAVSLGSLMLLVLRGYYAEQEREYLTGNAMALRPLIEQILQSKLPEDSFQDQIQALAFLSQTQIRLLDTEGNTVADSGVPDVNQVVAVAAGAPVAGNVMFSVPVDPPVEKGQLFLNNEDQNVPLPQIMPIEKQFLPGKSGDIILSVSASPYGYGFAARTKSDPAHRSAQRVSVLLNAANGKKLGTLEFSNGPSYGADVINSVSSAWLLASAFAVMIAALAGWWMSRRVTHPVLALEQATQQMERGNLSVRVHLRQEEQQEFVSLANSFNGMAEKVEQTISTLREFVADAAHELHTPLTALQANLELANDEENDSERTRYLTRALEQGQRLKVLVRSLLDLSRIEAAESKTDFAPVDITQLVREVGEQFASRAEQTERTFTMELAEVNLQILGNEMQLRQVLINLLENALKFTPAGGKISLKVERLADEIQWNVSDSGIGIPAQDLPYLFERFHRARNVSEYPGNGLGLVIVKAIVNLHKGYVSVRSEEKRGTVISVSLPALRWTDLTDDHILV
jgi:signal transduction histidine kinase